MKLFAVAPALLILVSLCGSPVPPPPGAVTGAVFFDANRNGIHDSCDSPLVNTQVVVDGPDGDSAIARTDVRGEFEIDDAPVGDGLVSLYTGDGLFWPVTTAPQAVHVASLKTTAGVEIGTASKAVYDADSVTISGIIFDDENGNGVVDRDECPLVIQAGAISIYAGKRIAVVSNGTYELKNMPAGDELAVVAEYGSSGGLISFGGDPNQPLQPTTGVPNGGCAVSVTPRHRYGPQVYEANIGFSAGNQTSGSVSGVVFNDANESGVRDEGEAGVANVSLYLYLSEPSCYSGKSEVQVLSGPDGGFRAPDLPGGRYTASVSTYALDATTLVSGPTSPPLEFTIGGGETKLDVPLRVIKGATIEVLAFDDENGNGQRDAGEDLVPNVGFCVAPADPVPSDFVGGGYGCPATDYTGVARAGPLQPGNYRVTFSGGFFVSPIDDEVSVHLEDGETRQITFALNVVTPAEQVILPGAGQTLPLDVCYSDPAWVQPPFAAPGSDDLPAQMGLTAEQARRVYGHGIYPAGQNGWSYETAIWSELSGFDLTSPLCSRETLPIFALIGYEPLDVVTSFKSRIVQVRLTRRDSGLRAVSLPVTTDGGNDSYLFVDENYRPIVRCAPYGYCEWNDDTLPLFRGGVD